MASKKPKVPVAGSIHIDLTRPKPIDYRNAYIEDVMRHALGTGGVDPYHPSVSAGIYLDLERGELIEKTFVPAALVTVEAAPALSTAGTEYSRGGRAFYSPAPTGSWNVSMAGPLEVPPAHMAFEGAQLRTPLPGPPDDYMTDDTFYVPRRTLDNRERTVPLYTGHVDRFPAPTGRQFYYKYGARVALFPNNSRDPVSVLVEGQPKKVIYDVELDTAGLSDTWIFGNVVWEHFVKLTTNSKYTDERLRANFAQKMKMPYPKYKGTDADRSMLAYGALQTAVNIVYVKSGLCDIVFAHWDPPLRIVNFTIGVVDGATDGEIMSKFDGLLALGRGSVSESRVDPKGRYGPGITLPEAAWRQGLIKNREFWIHITDPTWDDDAPGHDFMCLGTYRNPFAKRVPTWLEVDCDPAEPNWRITLSRITVYDSEDRRRPRPNLLDYRFRRQKVTVDTGCSQTYMPGEFVDVVQKMFQTTYNVPAGSASYACPKSLMVCFYFLSDGREKAVEAQAVRFFISPDYVDADHPALCLRPGDRAFFGLNFFRSFIVGFRDDETRPILTIGKHRSVPDDREPRLACRKPSEPTREAGASTSTQPAPGANLRATDPPPAGETGGRGNSNPSKLRKPSVSVPAKDARGGGKGHGRTQSEQVPFPPYRAPLPGEDEGQGSSRYRRGSNAPVPQEAAYNRRTGRRPSGPYAPAAPAQFQQPANAGGAGWNPPPAQRTRGNSLSYGAPPPAQPVPAAQQQWAQPGAMYPPGGAPLQRTTSQPLAPIAGSRRPRPPALPIPVPPPVAPPQTSSRQPRPRTSSLTTGFKNLFGIGKKPGKR